MTFITEISILIITIVVAIVAIKFTFSFNINEHLKRKDEKLKGKIRNYCPHATMEKVGDKVAIQGTFISPSGTTMWICEMCGQQLYTLNRQQEDERLKWFAENPKEFAKKRKKFEKLVKKAGLL